jgi:hypothetical protein
MLADDEQALNDQFWATTLSYVNDHGVTVTLTDDDKLIANQPDEDIDETKPWVRFTIEAGSSDQATTGLYHAYNQLGVAYLQVFAPKGSGMKKASSIRDQFAGAFRNWSSDDGHCHTYKLSYQTIEQATYAQINVTVYWESRRTPS